jgi:hypothetical protein
MCWYNLSSDNLFMRFQSDQVKLVGRIGISTARTICLRRTHCTHFEVKCRIFICTQIDEIGLLELVWSLLKWCHLKVKAFYTEIYRKTVLHIFFSFILSSAPNLCNTWEYGSRDLLAGFFRLEAGAWSGGHEGRRFRRCDRLLDPLEGSVITMHWYSRAAGAWHSTVSA